MKHSSIIPATLLCVLCISCTCRAPKATVNASLTRDSRFTGRSNTGESLMTIRLDNESTLSLLSLDVTLNGDLGVAEALNVTKDGQRIGGTKVKAGKNSYRISCKAECDSLSTLVLSADISSSAPEGSKISADVTAIAFKGAKAYPEAPEDGAREVLPVRRKLFGPGDYGSKNYRIPAIYTLADGSLLTATDKRKFNQNDLPDDIDVIASRSTDGGLTWSGPVTVEEGKGFGKGFGDAALVTTASGDVLCAYSGGPGLWASNEEVPACNYIRRSRDNGATWEDAVELHGMFWGRNAVHKECRDSHSAFFASGRGLRLEKGEHAGRVMFVVAIHSRRNNRFDNYIVYSDDEGQSWNMSELAFVGGDEAKVVELPDGRILLSVRRSGERGYNISEDGGVTWGEQGLWPEITVNACDGDIICVGDSLLLHSVPNSMKRENVSIFVSRDNGQTWPYVKSICPYNSVYSSITVLPDGTIGAYIEESVDGQIEMWFMNFSLDWLLTN